MKTIIFVDGENLYYNLRALNLEVNHIDWTKFLNECLEDGDNLIRAYWYQAAQTSDPRITEDSARRFLSKTHAASDIDDEKLKSVMASAKQWKDECDHKYKTKLDFYDNLAIRFPVIEMVRTGVLKIDPFAEKYIGEKGLDVSLAIGMVRHQEHCDKIILISGDVDYAEAIKFVKDKMKRVHIVRLFKGEPPTNRSVSRKLRELADRVVDIYEADIKDRMLVSPSGTTARP